MEKLNFIPQSVATALGFTLLHALWQLTLLAMGLRIALFFIKQSTTKYQLGMATLFVQLLASGFTFWYFFEGEMVITNTPIITQAANVSVQIISQSPNFLTQVQTWFTTHANILVQVWFFGVIVLLMRLLIGFIHVQNLRKEVENLVDISAFEAILKQIKQRMGITRKVQIATSYSVFVPMVIGHLKPVILLPIGLVTRLSMAEVEAILAHELAHIQRHDFLFNIIQTLVETLFFFHPAVWWLSTLIRTERENCCDDLAVMHTQNRLILAKALSQVANYHPEPNLAMAFGGKKYTLLQRIKRIVGLDTQPKITGNVPMILLTVLLLGVGLSIYSCQQKPDIEKVALKNEQKTATFNDVFQGKSVIIEGIFENEKMVKLVSAQYEEKKLSEAEIARLQKIVDEGKRSTDDFVGCVILASVAKAECTAKSEKTKADWERVAKSDTCVMGVIGKGPNNEILQIHYTFVKKQLNPIRDIFYNDDKLKAKEEAEVNELYNQIRAKKLDAKNIKNVKYKAILESVHSSDDNHIEPKVKFVTKTNYNQAGDLIAFSLSTKVGDKINLNGVYEDENFIKTVGGSFNGQNFSELDLATINDLNRQITDKKLTIASVKNEKYKKVLEKLIKATTPTEPSVGFVSTSVSQAQKNPTKVPSWVKHHAYKMPDSVTIAKLQFQQKIIEKLQIQLEPLNAKMAVLERKIQKIQALKQNTSTLDSLDKVMDKLLNEEIKPLTDQIGKASLTTLSLLPPYSPMPPLSPPPVRGNR